MEDKLKDIIDQYRSETDQKINSIYYNLYEVQRLLYKDIIEFPKLGISDKPHLQIKFEDTNLLIYESKFEFDNKTEHYEINDDSHIKIKFGEHSILSTVNNILINFIDILINEKYH